MVRPSAYERQAALPVVAPAPVVSRSADAADALPPGQAVGRISRAITENSPTTDSPESSSEGKSLDIDRISEQVYQNIRRKLLVERERTGRMSPDRVLVSGPISRSSRE